MRGPIEIDYLFTIESVNHLRLRQAEYLTKLVRQFRSDTKFLAGIHQSNDFILPDHRICRAGQHHNLDV